MVFTVFLAFMTVTFLFFAWLQGREHKVKALFNIVMAACMFLWVGVRFLHNDHPMSLPNYSMAQLISAWHDLPVVVFLGVVFIWTTFMWAVFDANTRRH